MFGMTVSEVEEKDIVFYMTATNRGKG